ncbi:hypothetical protein LTR50_005046 [Elasticomyces elasticus]|nr:hypothetical protein LTR50_005046 [Elasticomyces elasticus]
MASDDSSLVRKRPRNESAASMESNDKAQKHSHPSSPCLSIRSTTAHGNSPPPQTPATSQKSTPSSETLLSTPHSPLVEVVDIDSSSAMVDIDEPEDIMDDGPTIINMGGDPDDALDPLLLFPGNYANPLENVQSLSETLNRDPSMVDDVLDWFAEYGLALQGQLAAWDHTTTTQREIWIQMPAIMYHLVRYDIPEHDDLLLALCRSLVEIGLNDSKYQSAMDNATQIACQIVKRRCTDALVIVAIEIFNLVDRFAINLRNKQKSNHAPESILGMFGWAELMLQRLVSYRAEIGQGLDSKWIAEREDRRRSANGADRAELLAPLSDPSIVVKGAEVVHRSATIPDLQESAPVNTNDLLPARDYTVFISQAWKLRALYSLFCSERMPLRVGGIEAMARALIEIYSKYNQGKHPLAQRLAEFMVEERMVQSIVSPNSHPDLVARSKNIVGFLAVTNIYSQQETDDMWKIVSERHQRDIVIATLSMLQQMFHLIEVPQLLYFCSKLQELPLSRFTKHVISFTRDLFEFIERKVGNALRDGVQLDADMMLARSRLCLRLLHELGSQVLPENVASEELSRLATFGVTQGLRSLEDRQHVYNLCIEDLRTKKIQMGAQGLAATGSIRAILSVLPSNAVDMEHDLEYLRGVLRYEVLDKLCFFLKDLETALTPGRLTDAVFSWLDLAFRLISSSVPLTQTHLEALVGPKATAREIAWEGLRCHMATETAATDSILRNTRIYMSNLGPAEITAGTVNWTKAAAQYLIVRNRTTIDQSAASGTLQIPFVEEVTQMILKEPTDTSVLARLVQLAVCMHLDNDVVRRYQSAAITTQAKYVRRCVGYLMTDTPASQKSTVLMLLGAMLDSARSVPAKIFCSPEPEVKVREVDVATDMGNVHTFHLQIYEAKRFPTKLDVRIGELSPVSQLAKAIGDLVQTKNFTVLGLGRTFDLEAMASTSIKDSSLATVTNVLIKRTYTVETLAQEVWTRVNRRPAVERELVSHFDDLNALLDEEKLLAQPAYELLYKLHFPASARTAVTSNDASALFPPDKPYRSAYTIKVLCEILKDQAELGVIDGSFVVHGVQTLISVLLQTEDSDDMLVGALVPALLMFLRERPTTTYISQYFSNESAFIARLVAILPSASTEVLFQCHKILFEASCLCPSLWQVFTSQPGIVELYEKLLTRSGSENDQGILAVMDCITQDFCGPKFGSITVGSNKANGSDPEAEESGRRGPELATNMCAFWWRVVDHALPRSIITRSPYVPDAAAYLFGQDDSTQSDTGKVRETLNRVTEMLLTYKHAEEIIGGDPDTISLGLIRLLSACVKVLKRTTKLVVPGLVVKLFRTFLFQPFDDDGIPSKDMSDPALPLLHATSRDEMYELILSLCNDLQSYEQLLYEVSSVSRQVETDGILERGELQDLRSKCGYAGIINYRFNCYMNALVQQLYMNMSFRKLILTAPVSKDDDRQQVLVELRSLFATMQNGNGKAVAPDRLMQSQGIEVKGDMEDANEHLTGLLDRLEMCMSTEDAKASFRALFIGRSIVRITGDCKHTSETPQPFNKLELTLQDMASLEESLREYVGGEVLEGSDKYKCAQCGNVERETAIKR